MRNNQLSYVQAKEKKIEGEGGGLKGRYSRLIIFLPFTSWGIKRTYRGCVGAWVCIYVCVHVSVQALVCAFISHLHLSEPGRVHMYGWHSGPEQSSDSSRAAARWCLPGGADSSLACQSGCRPRSSLLTLFYLVNSKSVWMLFMGLFYVCVYVCVRGGMRVHMWVWWLCFPPYPPLSDVLQCFGPSCMDRFRWGLNEADVKSGLECEKKARPLWESLVTL